MRFVQFSDTHLDSALGGALGLPAEKKAILRDDIRIAVTRACQLAIDNKADLVLIPGDLFDYESLQRDTSDFLVDAFKELAPIRVFVTPGNHDSLRPGNPYLTRLGAKWTDNVHVFTASDFETVTIDDLGCSVTGIAHAHRGITDRLIAPKIIRSGSRINILLFHGSRDGFKPSEKENVIPFSDVELITQGFTYAAIGHYHSLAQILDEAGAIKGAYSGCIQGRGLDEAGEKIALLGEIDQYRRVSLQPIEVAPRRIVSVEVNVTGVANSPAIVNRIDSAISAAGARECDAVNVALTGMLPQSIRIDTSRLEESANYFHLNFNCSRIGADYDLESLARDSAASPLRSAFVRRMLELKNWDDDRAIEDAVYYGLCALDGRRLEPRDAN